MAVAWLKRNLTVPLDMLRIQVKAQFHRVVSPNTIVNFLDCRLITLRKLYLISLETKSQIQGKIGSIILLRCLILGNRRLHFPDRWDKFHCFPPLLSIWPYPQQLWQKFSSNWVHYRPWLGLKTMRGVIDPRSAQSLSGSLKETVAMSKNTCLAILDLKRYLQMFILRRRCCECTPPPNPVMLTPTKTFGVL